MKESLNKFVIAMLSVIALSCGSFAGIHSETWFSTRIDRWPAAPVAALIAVALWRLQLPRALSDFKYSRVTE